MSVDKESTLWVPRGLYVLRYDSSPSEQAPLAFVAAAPGAERLAEIVSAPGAEPGRLGGPGEALVIRAFEPVSIVVGVKRRSAQGSLEASLKLEALGAASAPAAAPTLAVAPPAPKAAKAAEPEVPCLFVAHVARRGDLKVRAGDWAAGPDTPARIEGLEALPLAQEGTQFEIQTLTAGGDWSPWCGAGSFAGSRGRNLPVVGLRLRLSGPEAKHYWLNSDVLFVGASVVSQRGRELEFLSPTGLDPLVGLRLDIRPERRLSGWQMARNTNNGGEPRVRVFRAAAG